MRVELFALGVRRVRRGVRGEAAQGAGAALALLAAASVPAAAHVVSRAAAVAAAAAAAASVSVAAVAAHVMVLVTHAAYVAIAASAESARARVAATLNAAQRGRLATRAAASVRAAAVVADRVVDGQTLRRRVLLRCAPRVAGVVVGRREFRIERRSVRVRAAHGRHHARRARLIVAEAAAAVRSVAVAEAVSSGRLRSHRVAAAAAATRRSVWTRRSASHRSRVRWITLKIKRLN